jgi:phosphoribosylformylglycinamidine synthase subunit PurL
MALAGNGRWCYLDPKLGAMHAVAEAARKVACTGATPVAATNCLNFGNPEKPEIMAQLSEAIDGIAEACTALGTPITGGNVSLYNETRGEGIYPTPVMGIVGIIDDATKAVPASFQREGDVVLVLEFSFYPEALGDFGSSEFAKRLLGSTWGTPPWLEIRFAVDLQRFLVEAGSTGLLTSACDIGSGGLLVALARASFGKGIGIDADSTRIEKFPECFSAFAEAPAAIISCDPSKLDAVREIADANGLSWYQLGTTAKDVFRFSRTPAKLNEPRGPMLIDTTIDDLHRGWSTALESHLTEEVTA